MLLSPILFGEGFITGLILTLMAGPVTMVILRHGMQANRMAGMLAATGTWVSDFVFIACTFWMTTAIDGWIQQPGNRLGLFLAGGLGLLCLGLWMLKIKRNMAPSGQHATTSGYIQAFTSGFMVNSLSPFTLFFWLGVAVFLHMQAAHPLWYYAGVMMSLALGDTGKALLAPKLPQLLHEKHVYWLQIAAGVLIGGTGVYVMIYGLLGG